MDPEHQAQRHEERLSARTGVALESGSASPYPPTLRRTIDHGASPLQESSPPSPLDGSDGQGGSISGSSSSASLQDHSMDLAAEEGRDGHHHQQPQQHHHAAASGPASTSAAAAAPAAPQQSPSDAASLPQETPSQPTPPPPPPPPAPPAEQSVDDATAATAPTVADAAEDPPEVAPTTTTTSAPSAGQVDAPAQQGRDEAAPSPAQTGLAHLLTSVLHSMRSMVPGGDASQPQPQQQQPDERPAGNATSGTTASETGAEGTAPQQGQAAAPGPPPVLYFRMPFNGPDGNPAMLAFHPTPLPHAPANRQAPAQGQQQGQAGQQNQEQAQGHPATNATPAPGMEDTGSMPHPAGHVPRAPLFVPLGASPLPFSFIYDAPTATAWPIAHVVSGVPPGGPGPDASAAGGAGAAAEDQQPRLVAGPPFRILLDLHFVPNGAPPEPERPDPEKAKAYVKALERADAELRSRMARLHMGEVGSFAGGGGSDGDGEGDALLGCGVCLDNYEEEDRPEWIGGERSEDEAVVALPCPGHHSLHSGCLRDWLAKTPPSQWTCPFCRASLDAAHPTPTLAAASSGSKLAGQEAAAASTRTTLREEVRRRERQRGWRCDAPACLPRYPAPVQSTSGADRRHAALNDETEEMSTRLVDLAPCHHQVHLDCLCTSMRIESGDVGCDFQADDEGLEDDGDIGEDEEKQRNSAGGEEVEEVEEVEEETTGKWVSCPACRKETWARLPIRRRPRSVRPQGDGDDTKTKANAVAAEEGEPSSISIIAGGESEGEGKDEAAPAPVSA